MIEVTVWVVEEPEQPIVIATREQHAREYASKRPGSVVKMEKSVIVDVKEKVRILAETN